MIELDEKMNFPPDQLATMKPMAATMQSMMLPVMIVWLVLFLGYLLWIRRFFVRHAD